MLASGNSAIVMTAYNRLDYFTEVLASWQNVRGFETVPFYVFLEPSEIQDKMVEAVQKINHPDSVITLNRTRLGVLENPYLAFSSAFVEHDFVIRAEDDLLVSSDILEYFDWAASTYADDYHIGAVVGHTHDDGAAGEVVRSRGFSPWVWGTWRDRWQSLIGPTWDRDYSTYNDYPGNQAGWDWNLNTRVFPRHSLQSIFPCSSRVQNIGQHGGTHADPAEFAATQTDSFQLQREPVTFFERIS